MFVCFVFVSTTSCLSPIYHLNINKMSTKKSPMDQYKKFLINRASTSTPFVELIEHVLASEDEAANHCFHKVMVQGWSDSKEELFDTFSEYFTSSFVPVNLTTVGGITSFYTNSLSFLNKIIRYDFLFPHQHNMFNVEVMFNDKTSTELFDNSLTIDDIVSGVVSRRFTDKKELDLSNFCDDQEFVDKKICFYKITLLGNFKILMLRMGRDTKSLNLSHNNLSQPPLEILNFFIKGDLTSINLSYNNIPSISDLFRVSSKIEKLWVEGNPLCAGILPAVYVKSILMKFPRLSELDGVKINDTGLTFPFVRNYVFEPNRKKKNQMLVDQFLTIYFSHYDTPGRPKILGFYDPNATLTISTGFPASEEVAMTAYTSHSRNLIKKHSRFNDIRLYKKHSQIKFFLCDRLPSTQHDPGTFTVDVLHNDKRMLLLVVTGVFRERNTPTHPAPLLYFQRTFVLSNQKQGSVWTYLISNEMYHISAASPEQIASSFKNPLKNPISTALVDPARDEIVAMVKIFTYITQLKKEEAEIRLRLHHWDMRQALQDFVDAMTKNNVSHENFIDEDDLSDLSSLTDDDID